MVTPDLYSAAGISSTDQAFLESTTFGAERTGRDIVASYLAGAYGPVGSAAAIQAAKADIAKWYLGPAYNMDPKYVDTQASMSFDSWVFEATGGGQQQPTPTVLTAEQQRLLDLAKAEEGLAGGAGTTAGPTVSPS